MKKIYICFVLGILALFLGWIPKLGADGVSWFLDNDFAHLYLTGSLVRAGVDPYSVDLAPLYPQSGFTPTREIPFAGAPPALAIVIAPFTLLQPLQSYLLWTVLQVGALLLGSVIMMRVVGLRYSFLGTIAVLCGVLAPLGVFAHLRYGQTQALMFLLIAIGVALVQRDSRWMWRGGLILWGVASSLKLFTAPLLFVAWRYRGREGALWFMIGFGLLCVPFALWCGFGALLTFASRTVPYLQEISVAFNGNISLSGALTYTQRIILGGEVLSVRAFQIVSLLAFVPLCMVEWRERKDVVAATVSCVAASCLLSPTTWSHYLPLLTGGFLYLLARAQRAGCPEPALWSVFGLYICLGCTLGYTARGDIVMQLVSAWWGALGIVAMLVMIVASRRRKGVFA